MARTVRRPASTVGRGARFRDRLNRSAVLLLALSIVGSLYTAFAAPGSAQEEQQQAAQSLAVREGRALYLTGCSTCHGLNLEGGAGGPSLIGVGASAVIFQVESGRMPLAAGIQQAPRKRPKYSVEEIDQMAAYIQARGGGPQLPEGSLIDGDLAEGGELFRTNCSSCHNAGGAGGALTYGKYAPALYPASPRVIYTAMQHGPEQMPRFTDAQLSVEEKKAITRYVAYLNEAAQPGGNDLGRFGPVPEGLVAWLVGISSMVILTLWIGNRS